MKSETNVCFRVVAYGTSLALGCVLTYVCVMSGFDWHYLLWSRSHASLVAFLSLGPVVGMIVPIFVPLGLLISYQLTRNSKTLRWFTLLATAALIGFCLSTFIKLFTGRTQPDLHNMTVDISHAFHFGFMHHGFFWGWPSSHTTVAFAMSVAVVVLLYRTRARTRRTLAMSILLMFYALYIGLSVSITIHWFSDFLMGVILGTIIGIEVGNHVCCSEIHVHNSIDE